CNCTFVYARGILCSREQSAHVEPHQRRGNHSEVGKRRVTSTDVGLVKKRALEFKLGCGVDELRTGIGDGDKVLARVFFQLTYFFVPKLVEDVWLSRAAGLRGDDKQTTLDVDPFFKSGDH